MLLKRKSFKILCTISAVIIAFFSFSIVSSAATVPIPFENLTVEEAVMYRTDYNGTILNKIGDLTYQSDEIRGYDGMMYLLYETYSGSDIPEGYVCTVLGADLNPNTDIYSVSIDVYFPFPVQSISWVAIQTKDGEAIFADKIIPLTASDVTTKLAETLTPNTNGEFGYRYVFPVRRDYNNYIMFKLFSKIEAWWHAPGVYNLYSDFNFEFYYSAPDGSAIGDLKDNEDAVLNSDVKILTGYDSYGNPIYSDGSLSDLSNNFIDDLQSNVKSLLLTSRTSLMAAGNFLSKLFGLSGISGLLFLSLALGIVPLIVGLGVYAMRSSDRANYRAEINRERAERFNNRRGK